MFNILLVEDNTSFRQTLSGILSSHFPTISVTEADDGEAAMQKVEQLNPDMIFMDIKLPGENGLQLTRKIKRAYSRSVIIILSSYDLPEYRQQAFRNGADCFLTKADVSCVDNILARIEGALATKRAQ